MRMLLAAAALLAAPAAASDEVPFEPSARIFADAAACRTHLGELVAEARAAPHVAAEGPYEIAAGDVRAHKVLLAGSGHRITEHRSLAEKLSGRTWRHSMDDSEDEAPETIESMAANWLKKGKPR